MISTSPSFIRRSRLLLSPVKGKARLFAGQSSSTENATAVVLYQYAICPFCNQVKSFMEYVGIPYEAVEVNPLSKSEIKWSKDYRKVPIAKFQSTDEAMFGSEVIVDKLLSQESTVRLLERRWEGTDMNLKSFQSPESAKWTTFAKDELASLLYPNMCRTWSDSYRAFGYVNDVPAFGAFQKFAIRNLGSLAMYMAASRVKKKRNIRDERGALNEILLQLEEEGLKSDKFLSKKDEPDLGDLAVYGTLRAIEGLPCHEEVIDGRGGSLPDWYRRVAEKIQVQNM